MTSEQKNMTVVEQLRMENPLLFEQERVMLDVGELIQKAMDEQGISIEQLAQKTGYRMFWMHCMLAGSAYLTDIVRICHALGLSLQITAKPIDYNGKETNGTDN